MKNKTILFNSFNTFPIDKNILNVFMILIGSLSIGLLAQASIPIPFSPVPITGQTIRCCSSWQFTRKETRYIIYNAIFNGRKFRFTCVCEYAAGAHILIGPTGGYLFSFIIAAFLMGYCKEKGFIISPINCFLACFVSQQLFYLLVHFTFLYWLEDIHKGFAIGFYPFLIGDIIKSFICTIIIQGSRRLLLENIFSASLAIFIHNWLLPPRS